MARKVGRFELAKKGKFLRSRITSLKTYSKKKPPERLRD